MHRYESSVLWFHHLCEVFTGCSVVNRSEVDETSRIPPFLLSVLVVDLLPLTRNELRLWNGITPTQTAVALLEWLSFPQASGRSMIHGQELRISEGSHRALFARSISEVNRDTVAKRTVPPAVLRVQQIVKPREPALFDGEQRFTVGLHTTAGWIDRCCRSHWRRR